MESIWKRDVRLHERKALGQEKDSVRKVQNLVIGAGMAGILTAYFLKERGQEVLVVEAGRIAGGQTEKTTAKITSQHGMIYEKLLRKCGQQRALGYARANEEAIALYEQVIREERIPCYFQRCPAYLYTVREEGITLLKEEARAAAALGIDAVFLDKNVLEWDAPGECCSGEPELQDLPFQVKAAVRFNNQARFHPLEFIRHLAAKLEICENTKVLAVKRHTVFTDKGRIQAENIVFATHYPFINIPGFYFLRQHQERSYVLALQGEGVPAKLSGIYYGIDKGAISLRSADGKLLFGGGGHRTGKRKPGTYSVSKPQCSECEDRKKGRDSGGMQEKIKEDMVGDVSGSMVGYNYLRSVKAQYYPEATEYTSWSAQDCMSHDGIPFIGKYSAFRSYWHVATGFHKWGMTASMVAAGIISDRICGKENPYQKVFSPQRLLVRAGIGKLCTDIGESIAGLTKGLFGKKARRCRHLGCHLNWNPEEESWDCPCHGSRFEKDGRLIDNPAQRDLERK